VVDWDKVGIALVSAGFLVILVGALMVALAAISGAITSGAIVIFIGPLPIVVGWGGDWLSLVLAALAIVAVMLLIAYIAVKR